MHEWYKINNVEQIDSPALVLYKDRIADNIKLAVGIAGEVSKLRPHVKTNKIAEVCEMMMRSGITKFKCATIAEAEMLGMIDAPDVLLAYQPVGPKIERLLSLIKAYQKTKFSCLVDNEQSAVLINAACEEQRIILDIFIDINVGMNRTGINPLEAVALIDKMMLLENLRIIGLHAYNGNIHDTEPVQRLRTADLSFDLADEVYQRITSLFPYKLVMVLGGTATFPMHVHRPNSECGPGTFVLWDWGYDHLLPEMPFEYAALVICRIISKVDSQHICVDLGYKAVAAESPLPRVHFLNAPEALPIAHSEEHLVLKVPDSSQYDIGDVFYGVPVHICPTVALYEKAFIIQEGIMTDTWKVIARDRFINF